MHVWFLPRRATVALARSRLRPLFRKLRRPLVAIGIWVLILYGWHFAFLFEAALRNDLLHAVQHQTFVLGAVLIWWPVVEPKKRRAPGELWKIPHILGARLAGMFLGMAFVLMSTPAYEGFYGDSAREHGLSPLTDQQIAGGMMIGLDLLVMLATVAFFFYRSADDHDRAAARAAALSALALLAVGLAACGGERRGRPERGGGDPRLDHRAERGQVRARRLLLRPGCRRRAGRGGAPARSRRRDRVQPQPALPRRPDGRGRRGATRRWRRSACAQGVGVAAVPATGPGRARECAS